MARQKEGHHFIAQLLVRHRSPACILSVQQTREQVVGNLAIRAPPLNQAVYDVIQLTGGPPVSWMTSYTALFNGGARMARLPTTCSLVCSTLKVQAADA